MTLEDIPHNPVIAPRAVLPGHPYHKGFDLFVDAGATNRRARRRGVNLLVCQGAVPGEDGVRLGDSGELCSILRFTPATRSSMRDQYGRKRHEIQGEACILVGV
jgi:hypothetical protein